MKKLITLLLASSIALAGCASSATPVIDSTGKEMKVSKTTGIVTNIRYIKQGLSSHSTEYEITYLIKDDEYRMRRYNPRTDSTRLSGFSVGDEIVVFYNRIGITSIDIGEDLKESLKNRNWEEQ